MLGARNCIMLVIALVEIGCILWCIAFYCHRIILGLPLSLIKTPCSLCFLGFSDVLLILRPSCVPLDTVFLPHPCQWARCLTHTTDVPLLKLLPFRRSSGPAVSPGCPPHIAGAAAPQHAEGEESAAELNPGSATVLGPGPSR